MIRKYHADDFPWLEKWVTDAKILFTFAGPSWTFPLSRQQLIQHQQEFPGKQLYVGLDENNEPMAIGEIITNEAHSPRLGRLLIGDPAKRGLGLGKKFILELIDTMIQLHQPDEICLFVLVENTSAIRTYYKIGFRFSEEKIPDMVFNNTTYPVFKMVLNTSIFRPLT